MSDVRHSDFELRHFAGLWPAVACLCPTYGRFECLRLALACFLAQDYPGEKRLLILNDAPKPISIGNARIESLGDACEASSIHDNVCITNVPPGTYTNLGEKRAALLQASSTELAAHWDDDDLYLPWHLTRSVAALLERDVGCVKSAGAYYMKGALSTQDSGLSTGLSVRGPCHNVFEGTMVFRREEALALGGYPPLHSGQAKALLKRFADAGRLFKIPDDHAVPQDSGLSTQDSPALPSYVYRWANGVGHISSIGNKADAAERFRRENGDFGKGELLTPGDLAPYWHAMSDVLSSASSVPLW
jgi:hypothetical protein